jgi:hypothetical protein
MIFQFIFGAEEAAIPKYCNDDNPKRDEKARFRADYFYSCVAREKACFATGSYYFWLVYFIYMHLSFSICFEREKFA